MGAAMRLSLLCNAVRKTCSGIVKTPPSTAGVLLHDPSWCTICSACSNSERKRLHSVYAATASPTRAMTNWPPTKSVSGLWKMVLLLLLLLVTSMRVNGEEFGMDHLK